MQKTSILCPYIMKFMRNNISRDGSRQKGRSVDAELFCLFNVVEDYVDKVVIL